jgi:hypothetical protein
MPDMPDIVPFRVSPDSDNQVRASGGLLFCSRFPVMPVLQGGAANGLATAH